MWKARVVINVLGKHSLHLGIQDQPCCQQSTAWHPGKGMVTEDVTNRADYTDLSHGTISSAWGYGFYGVATQIQTLRELSGQMFWPMSTLQSGFCSAAMKVCELSLQDA